VLKETFIMDSNQTDSGGLPFNREVMFANAKGVYKRGVEKRQLKLLKKLAWVKPLLKDKEEILLVTTGCSPVSVVEQLLTGWILFYPKRSIFVFTNQRLLHLPTTPSYNCRSSIAQINYADGCSLQLKGHSLTVRYSDNDKETFHYIAGQEVKKIKTLLPTLTLGNQPGRVVKRVHLCPRCTNELTKGNYKCARCKLEFKDYAEAKRLSLVYPGGGYFYTGHPFLGISDALVEAYLLIMVLSTAFYALTQHAGLEALAILCLLFFIEKAVSIYHSSHFVDEFIPKQKIT
jgi:hypothetical protein